MQNHPLRKIFRLTAVLTVLTPVLGAVVFILPRAYTTWRFDSAIFESSDAPEAPVAIVFGAGLRRDGRASVVLRDRVQTAAELYWDGKVERLLFSGDNRFINYNEPGAMRDYALSIGVPENALVLDFAGRRTYDTCRRASEVFGVRSAILVTQQYHLARALFTCAALGIDVAGVAADRSYYRALEFWRVREFPATTQAVWDLYIDPPDDVILDEQESIALN